jgi:hypothetical protein
MNIARMFAFVAAVLITAVLFRVIADGLTDRQEPGLATEVSSTDHPQTTGG